ncbi:MAG TPA: hypothetical protein DCO83_15720 [Mucilaginibacter sp.]|nr:hypothetical protein [Mucilaginibacter sp.]
MVGVNCHFAYPGVYTDGFLTLKSRMLELCLRHIRDENNGDNATFNDHVNQLAALGMRFDLVCEKWWLPLWTQNRNYLIATKNMPNAPVEFIEYPNEDDSSPTWVQDYDTFFTAFRGGDSNTSGIPIFGPSFANTPSGPQYFLNTGGSDMSAKMDYANLHSYPGGEYVEGPMGGGWGNYTLDQDIAEYDLINAAHKTFVASETGYQLPQPGHGNLPVAESVAAKYEPRLLMWYLLKGFKYAYHYQLINNNTDENFGLLNPDMSRRQTFYAIKNTIKIFNDPGATFQPGTLNYSLAGNAANVKSMVFQKRNGKFYLVLWQAIASGTASNNAATPPYDFRNPTIPVTVSVNGISGTALGYTPSVDSVSVASFSNIKSMKVNVPDHIYVLEITH